MIKKELIGTDTTAYYMFGNEVQHWNLKNFKIFKSPYDPKEEVVGIEHGPQFIAEVFLKSAFTHDEFLKQYNLKTMPKDRSRI